MSTHLSTDRLKNFLLHETPLLEWEQSHLMRCVDCLNGMVQHALQELEDEKEKASAQDEAARAGVAGWLASPPDRS